MNESRLEAFSDGVLAIIITIMVLELEAPKETTFEAIIPSFPIFISYLGSFIYIGVYWNSHHHLFQIIGTVNNKILWANLHLLFWLSLIPFTTSWIGENHIDAIPVALYGFVLLMSRISFFILKQCIIGHIGKTSVLGKLIGRKEKDIIFSAIYIMGALLAFLNTYIGIGCFVIVIFFQIIELKKMRNSMISIVNTNQVFPKID
ncbi:MULTISPECIES: TMEM175 family protein [Aquimarina]|uniref:TMEM175 family protein n=1 Tax=Aquimarina TaxID=290174 RepID=UPI000D685761|nr:MULTISPECIES: TMEM175 family protein [Aquimarina]